MAKRPYDPYYRNFPSTALPARTPFTHSGRGDAGHVFSYLTHRKPNWSLLLDKSRLEDLRRSPGAHPQGFHPVPVARKGVQPRLTPPARRSAQPAPDGSRTLVVLREPDPIFTRQGNLVSHHLHEGEAIAAADTYARLNQCRALIGLVVWDERWYWCASQVRPQAEAVMTGLAGGGLSPSRTLWAAASPLRTQSAMPTPR